MQKCKISCDLNPPIESTWQLSFYWWIRCMWLFIFWILTCVTSRQLYVYKHSCTHNTCTHMHNACTQHAHTHMHNRHIHMSRYQQYVGHVSYVTFDQSVQGSKHLLVASESGALAAVNTRTGNISKKFLYCGCVHILYTDITKERGVL